MGGRARLRVRYRYQILPEPAGGRTAWVSTRNSDIYDVAQWYPRMAVYDDVRCWDPLPYLEQQFYLEYGTFDYAVTVPADMLVVGSGALVNPNEILTAEEVARLAQARSSERTVTIHTAEEAAAPAPAMIVGSDERRWAWMDEGLNTLSTPTSPTPSTTANGVLSETRS